MTRQLTTHKGTLTVPRQNPTLTATENTMVVFATMLAARC
jgi:hypothetical protein